MQQAIPSRTALRVALRRAAHQLYDKPLVFDDPIAVPLLGETYAEELHRTPTRIEPAILYRPARLPRRPQPLRRRPPRPGRRPRRHPVRPARRGLDTFAHRNPYPHLRVFEVDHPATQQWKRELLLASATFPHPANLTYAPVDFERQSLPAQLHAAGFDSAAPTFFAWLGVVPYLTLPAFRATLAFIASQPPGSGIVFDYGQPRSALPSASSSPTTPSPPASTSPANPSSSSSRQPKSPPNSPPSTTSKTSAPPKSTLATSPTAKMSSKYEAAPGAFSAHGDSWLQN